MKVSIILDGEYYHGDVERTTPTGERATEDSSLHPPVTVGANTRVARCPSEGDKVFLLDDTAKTKKWVKSPEELEKLGYTLADVVSVTNEEMAAYKRVI